MKINKLIINTIEKNYSIIIGTNLLEKISAILKKEKIQFNKCLIIADTNVPKKFVTNLKKKIKTNKIFVKKYYANEKNKNYKSVNKILNFLFNKNFSRDDCLISVGGGISGDVVGYAASIYKRGLKFINIPTTLLAQVDSSIGGKTGINNRYGKNLIGSFYQPDLVISDILFLKSLSKRNIICGYAEILKHSLISSRKNFLYLDKFKNEIISLKSPFIKKAIIDSCKTKKKVVQKDEKEKNFRKILNFGHTFAHAYEASLKFSNKLNHGEAVILGIKDAIKFSYQNKFLSKKKYDEILNHINSLNLKIDINKFFSSKDIKSIINFIRLDKKNKSSKINLVLLNKISKPIINSNFNTNKIESFLKKELIN